MYDFLLPAFQFVRFWSLQQRFLYRPKEKDSHNHKMEKALLYTVSDPDYAGDGTSCTRGLQTIDAVFGYYACSNRNFQKRRCF